MSPRLTRRCFAALLGVAAAAPALAQTTHQEAEPNHTKDSANAVTMASGDSIVGSAQTFGGADYFLITPAAAPPGIYQHRLVLSPSQNHFASLRGLLQVNGEIQPGTDEAVQFAQTFTSPPRLSQWYGFGRAEPIYYRVEGNASSPPSYTATLTTTPVTPVEIGPFQAGTIEFRRGPNTFINSEYWVYDANLEPIPGYTNTASNILVRDFAPGVYYLAYATRNLANDLPNNHDVPGSSDPALDFPGPIAAQSNTLFPFANLRVIDGAADVVIDAPRDDHFKISWFRFTVSESVSLGACCLPDGSCALRAAATCTAQGGTYGGDNVPCESVACRQPGACCFPDHTCYVMSETECQQRGGAYQGDGSACGACPPAPPGVTPEAEPNDTKATAHGPIVMAHGDSIIGYSMGLFQGVPGVRSADYFLVQTAPLPPGVYRHRLIMHNILGGRFFTLRGLAQADGVIDPDSDAEIHRSRPITAGSTTHFIQWYGFGAGERVYVMVEGDDNTPDLYTLILATTPVTPADAGDFTAGPITIDRPAGDTGDADFWVYDGNFDAIPTCGNDEPNTLTRTYAPGTYTIAYAHPDLSNDQPAAGDELRRDGRVMDFPGAVALSVPPPWNGPTGVRISDDGGSAVVSTPQAPYTVNWIRFTVSAGAGDCNGNGVSDAAEIAANPALDCFNPSIIASPHITGGPDGALDACQCAADWGRDLAVNSADISGLLASWLAAVTAGNQDADIDCSGATTSADISAYLTRWLDAVTDAYPYDGCP